MSAIIEGIGPFNADDRKGFEIVGDGKRDSLRRLDRRRVDEFVSAIGDNVVVIDRTLQEAQRPAAGAYAIFHHSSHLVTRTRDVGRVMHRLLAGRESLTTALAEEGDHLASGAEPYAEPHQEFLRRIDDASQHMRQDLETLYLFGHLQLDQFAHIALRVGGLPVKEPGNYGASAFTLLCKWLENGRYGALRPLWSEAHRDLVWLRWQLWFYRNRFVVHADRPWQRGANYGHVSNDFKLHIPAPIGWDNYETVHRAAAELWRRVQTHLCDTRSPEETAPGVLLSVMFDRIDELPTPEVRREVGDLYERMGGMTPTFQVVGGRLLQFVHDGTAILTNLARERGREVDLGQPYVTQNELTRRYGDASENTGEKDRE